MPHPSACGVSALPAASRAALAPVVYVAGLVVLGVALFFLWRYPAGSRRAADDSNRLTVVQTQVSELTDRLGKLEARQTVDLGPLDARVARLEGRSGPDLGPVEGRLARLEARPVPDVGALDGRVKALEARPAPDLSGVTGRVEAVARDDAAAGSKRDGEIAALGRRLDEVRQQVAGVDAHVADVEKRGTAVTQIAARAERTAKVQAATAALEAGKPLGTLPDAPAALSRFATQAPPTLAALRLVYGDAAAAAQRASQPAVTGERNFLGRAWAIAQGTVTVRQGDRVLVGDPISGILGHARELLDAGDIAGCVRVLDGLAGPAKAAMADWVGQAQSLLDARAALAVVAAG